MDNQKISDEIEKQIKNLRELSVVLEKEGETENAYQVETMRAELRDMQSNYKM
jgi:hypothetical protein